MSASGQKPMARSGVTVAAVLVALLLSLPPAGGCARGRHPALDIIARCEPVGPSPQVVRPYFANLDAITLVRHRQALAAVARYIGWYLDHVGNGGDGCPAGLIDDYTVHHGRYETPTGRADSADAYAATFLILIDEFEQATGHRDLLQHHRARLESVAELLLSLQDPDGLVHALPGGPARYLMDNCEVYGGLVAWDALSRRLGWEAGPRWRAAAERLRRAVLDRLYDPLTHRFHWAESDGIVQAASWERFYPDALAQLFPILYGIVAARGEIARGLWREFAARYDPRGGYPVSANQRVLIDMTREKVQP